MKIAVLSDIHSNIVALEEVLKDAKAQNVDEYLSLILILKSIMPVFWRLISQRLLFV